MPKRLVLGFYALATVVLAGPFVNYRHLASAVYGGDTRLILWTLAWDSHAMLHGLPLFQANIFYPAPDALAYNEHLFGLALFYLPIYALTGNPALAYNILWLAAWILNAVAAHSLARRYLRNELAALVGGLIFTFSFFRMLHGHGHLSLAWTFWIPLSLIALERWHRRAGWGMVAWWTFTVVMQVLTNWYLALLVLLANAVFLACLLLFDRGGAREQEKIVTPGPPALRRAMQLAAAVVVLFLAVWPFARHYRNLPAATPYEAARYSADAVAYLVPALNTWPGQLLVNHGVRYPRWIWEEATLYLGFVALAFAAIGLVAVAWPGLRRRFPHFPRSAAVFFPLLGIVALVLSLGPTLGHGPFPRLAFDWFSRLPGAGGARVPARFALLVVLALSVLGAAGAAWLHQRFRIAGRVVTVLLIPLMLSEWYVIDFPGGKPKPETMSFVYRRLADLPARAVVSLPMPTTRSEWTWEPDYLYYSTAHWHPIVNGYGRWAPDDHFWISGHMRAFAGHNSARTMRRLGIDYVVLHSDRGTEGPRMLVEALQNQEDFQFVMKSGPVYLFAVKSSPTATPALVPTAAR